MNPKCSDIPADAPPSEYIRNAIIGNTGITATACSLASCGKTLTKAGVPKHKLVFVWMVFHDFEKNPEQFITRFEPFYFCSKTCRTRAKAKVASDLDLPANHDTLPCGILQELDLHFRRYRFLPQYILSRPAAQCAVPTCGKPVEKFKVQRGVRDPDAIPDNPQWCDTCFMFPTCSRACRRAFQKSNKKGKHPCCVEFRTSQFVVL